MLINPSSKIKSIGELKELVHQSQKNGKCVVFANGCFDLIHVGHVRYLEDAKAQGNLLIVGINSDVSVGRLKGYGRPLQSEIERCEILGSFECVDYIVVFDDPTVDTILLSLKPDIHAKGTDYTRENVPERDTVASYGGRVAIVGDAKDHSTRDLISDILSKFSADHKH
jgi:D-glycero-beta-D-manno-heptose 1-phosphate adenylyltransferase